MKKYAIILAGGEGHRAGGKLPKQFVELLGIPILWWSVIAFHKEDPQTEITVVVHPGFFDDYDILHSELPEDVKNIPVRVVAGGRSRGESVANGLLGLEEKEDSLIAIHDAARPLVTTGMIKAGWECALKNGAAVPCIPVTDSLRELTDGKSVSVDRSRFVAVQTPQVFKSKILYDAYGLEEHPGFTDDASRVEASGTDITLYDGRPDNIKVTNPSDFVLAETLLKIQHLGNSRSV